MDRWYISRAALLNASRKGPDGLHKIDGLERTLAQTLVLLCLAAVVAAQLR